MTTGATIVIESVPARRPRHLFRSLMSVVAPLGVFVLWGGRAYGTRLAPSVSRHFGTLIRNGCR